MSEKKHGTIGIIGRWKPLNLGGYRVLRAACNYAEFVKIGIGSANKYDLRNPFTAKESKLMIIAALSPEFSNFEIIELPDFGHISEYRDGKKWTEFVKEKFGNLDFFISGNDYVRELLEGHYKLIYPWELLEKKEHIRLKSTQVRNEMAGFGDWERLVPEKVREYIKENKLDERFRREFGLRTLASATDLYDESVEIEKMHVMEGS